MPEYPDWATTRWLKFEYRLLFFIRVILGAAIIIRLGFL